jgi:hypothetical protein
MSPKYFETLGFILRETAVYAVWYVLHDCPTHQTAHTDACNTCHTAYTTVFQKMNPRDSKYVGDIRNLILIYKIVHFVGLCFVRNYELSKKFTIFFGGDGGFALIFRKN